MMLDSITFATDVGCLFPSGKYFLCSSFLAIVFHINAGQPAHKQSLLHSLECPSRSHRKTVGFTLSSFLEVLEALDNISVSEDNKNYVKDSPY